MRPTTFSRKSFRKERPDSSRRVCCWVTLYMALK